MQKNFDQKMQKIKNNLIRFVNIRNEFIYEYFNQNLKENDVLNALTNLSKFLCH